MTLQRAFVAVATSSLVCAAVGGIAGAALGKYSPDYYRTVVRTRPDVVFDPVQIGIGFGFNAGIFTGIVVGVVLVALVGYFELRLRQTEIREGVFHGKWCEDV